MGKKKESESTALVKLESFAIVKASPDRLANIIQQNFPSGTFGEFNMERIHVPSGDSRQFMVDTLEEGPAPVDSVTGIIVYFGVGRVYYETPFEESGGGSPPDCSSSDGITGQGTPGGLCRECEKNVFGGTKTGGKECKEQRLLYLVRPEESLPCVIIGPPGSIRPVTDYMVKLTQRDLLYSEVVTELGLQTLSSKKIAAFAGLRPRMVSVVPEEVRPRIEKYTKALRGILATAASSVMYQAEEDAASEDPDVETVDVEVDQGDVDAAEGSAASDKPPADDEDNPFADE